MQSLTQSSSMHRCGTCITYSCFDSPPQRSDREHLFLRPALMDVKQVKTRMQLQTVGPSGERTYTGMVDCKSNIPIVKQKKDAEPQTEIVHARLQKNHRTRRASIQANLPPTCLTNNSKTVWEDCIEVFCHLSPWRLPSVLSSSQQMGASSYPFQMSASLIELCIAASGAPPTARHSTCPS